MYKKKIAILSILLGFYGASTTSLVASTNVTTGQTDNTSAKKTPKPWKLGLGSTFESNLEETSSTDYSLTNTSYGSLKLTLDNGVSVSTSIAIDKDLQNDRETTLRDSALSFSKSLHKFNEQLSLAGNLSFAIPLSESSQNITNLYTSIRVRPSLSYDASKSMIDGLSFTYLPSLRTYFHQYETKSTGGSNTRYALSNRLVVSYSLTDSLGISFDNTYLRTWTYQGQSKDIYSLDQSIGYSINDNLAATIGHAIGGSVLAVNGQEQNIDLFNSQTSTIYFDLSLSY